MNNDVADWDWLDFNPEEWADEFVRILKPTGNLFIFTSYNQIGRWYDCLDKKFDTSNFMVWHKTNPAPKIFKAGFLNSCEMVFTCWNKKHTWNFISQAEMHNFIESPICMQPERLKSPKHPAQKPVGILLKMIDIATNEGDIVFDPFMGVGSMGVAALRKKRKFIGVEINKEYFIAAKNRIETEMKNVYSDIQDREQTCVSDFLLSPYGAVAQKIKADNDNDKIIPNKSNALDKSSSIRIAATEMRLSPILKWPGGKEKELKYIMPLVPQPIRNYYEPFVGGGSVFAAMHAERYYINDKSDELVALYENIAKGDKGFFELCDTVDCAWRAIHDFFESNEELVETYNNYKSQKWAKEVLQKRIKTFCAAKEHDIVGVVARISDSNHDVMLHEVYKNLTRKMSRMRVLEEEKGCLSGEDISLNIETALKSAFYMYMRSLYNKKGACSDNKALHSVLFLFIRNYCYSGMFRYNDKGEFNVPYGGMGYNSKSLSRKLLYYKSAELHGRFGHTSVSCLDFEDFLKQCNPSENDFVFLDPPYDTDFSTYANNTFDRGDQERLANYLLAECRAKWMVVIKNTEFIYNLYNRPGINIRTFDKEYIVSFMNRNNKKAEHLIITNY